MKLHRHLIDAAIEALRLIFAEKRHADQVVADFLKRHPKWGSRDRRLFAETVYDLVRWWRWYDFLAGGKSSGKPSATEIRRVWAAYWIDCGNELPDFFETEDSEPLVEEIAERKKADVPRAVRASVPDWLDAVGAEELGEAWPSVLDALNEPAPVFLRANRHRGSVDELSVALGREGIETEPVPELPDALRLETRRNLRTTRAYREGWFEIQDANSQRIVPLLEISPGMTVVDACAGAGGKTLQLAEALNGEGRLVAMDIRAPKLEELRRRAKRAGAGKIETRLVKPDAEMTDLAGAVDRVLLDVPCSGSGVLRRMPDTKWKLRPADLDRLRRVQQDLLNRHAAMVRPGGALVYATCSIFPSENDKQVQKFLAQKSGWELEEERRFFPETRGGDGFYAARLRRLGS